jgi:hypothetical protein
MTPYEAWCPRCKVTWAPGTRSCVHCGGPVSASRTPLASDSLPTLPAGADTAPRSEEAAPRTALRPVRFGIATLWLVVAVAGAIARHCARQ